jgi:hypothetical protein
MKYGRTFRITPEMVKAGADAMEQCRAAGGHTPRSACQAIFTAMLNAADSVPGADIRKSFAWSPHDKRRTFEIHNGKTVRGVITSRPPLERPLTAYRDLRIADYIWQGYHFQYRKHCFLLDGSDRDWIWLFEADWGAPNFQARLAEGAFRVDAVLCWQHLKSGRITKA